MYLKEFNLQLLITQKAVFEIKLLFRAQAGHVHIFWNCAPGNFSVHSSHIKQ